MRTETRIVRIGENVGAVDWSYDFRSHFDCMGSPDKTKDETCEQMKARFVVRRVVDRGLEKFAEAIEREATNIR